MDDNEDIKGAAAFAAGNFAVGAPKYLQPIVKQVETANDRETKLLSLHALKEVRAFPFSLTRRFASVLTLSSASLVGNLPLLSVSARERRRHPVDTPLRGLREPGGGNEERDRIVHRQADDLESCQVPASASGQSLYYRHLFFLETALTPRSSLDPTPIPLRRHPSDGRVGCSVHLHRHRRLLRRHPRSRHRRVSLAHARQRSRGCRFFLPSRLSN